MGFEATLNAAIGILHGISAAVDAAPGFRSFLTRKPKTTGALPAPAEAPLDPFDCEAIRIFDGVVNDTLKAATQYQVISRMKKWQIERMREVLSSGSAEQLAEFIFEVSGPGSEGGGLSDSGELRVGESGASIDLVLKRNLTTKLAMEAVLEGMVHARLPDAPLTGEAVFSAVRSWIATGGEIGSSSREISDFLVERLGGEIESGMARLTTVAAMVPALAVIRYASKLPQAVIDAMNPTVAQQIGQVQRLRQIKRQMKQEIRGRARGEAHV